MHILACMLMHLPLVRQQTLICIAVHNGKCVVVNEHCWALQRRLCDALSKKSGSAQYMLPVLITHVGLHCH